MWSHASNVSKMKRRFLSLEDNKKSFSGKNNLPHREKVKPTFAYSFSLEDKKTTHPNAREDVRERKRARVLSTRAHPHARRYVEERAFIIKRVIADKK